jgi:hypothetical protein
MVDGLVITLCSACQEAVNARFKGLSEVLIAISFQVLDGDVLHAF